MIAQPIASYELSDPKHQNPDLDEEESDDDDYKSGYSSSDFDEEDERLCEEEFERSGDFDFDFSRVRHTFHFKPVIFNERLFTCKPDTDRVLLEQLSKDAIKKYNEEEGTNLEFVEVLRANFHPAAGVTFYISFVVKDIDHQTQTFQTRISYLPMDIRIRFVRPKP